MSKAIKIKIRVIKTDKPRVSAKTTKAGYMKLANSALTITALVGYIISPVLMLGLPQGVIAADTGFLAPNQTVASNSVSGVSNGWASDNSRSIFDSSSDYADYGFADFGIIAGSAINGIEVTVEGRDHDGSGRNLTVALWNASNSAPDAYTSTQTAILPEQSSDVTRTLGGSTILWGKTWTGSDFADATFKIRVQATSSGGGNGDAELDQVQVKVYFTPPVNTAIHFIKAECPEWNDVAGNASATNQDATAGNYHLFSNYSSGNPHFPNPYAPKPVNPSEISQDCSRSAGWSFKLATNEVQNQNVATVGPTDGNGEYTINLNDLPTALKNALLAGNQMWVSEIAQPGSSFAALRCFADANNGDNKEYIEFNGAIPSDTYCVAYNILPTPARPGTLTVTKQFDIPEDAQIQVEISNFSFSINDGPAQNFEESGSDVSVPAGPYTVEETDPGAEWSVGYSDGCHGTMADNGQAECVITNTNIPSDLTTIKIIKNVINDNGGLAGPNDFGLTLDSGAVSSEQTTVVAAGDHTIGEAGLAGYSFVSMTGEGCPSELGGTVTLEEGQDLVCTITNDDIAPNLMLEKIVVGGDTSASAWTLTATGPTSFSGPGEDSNDGDVFSPESFQQGTYTLSESGPAGYNASAWDCTRGGVQNGDQITLGLGETAYCVITNTFVIPETDVELTKTVEPASVQSGSQTTFTLNVINHGPADAPSVIVTDALPSGLTYVSDSPSVGTYDSNTNIWTIGSLAVDETATLTITVTVAGTDGQVIVNQASVAIDPLIDINTDNNLASATVTVTVPGQGGNPTPAPEPVIDGGGGGGNGPIAQSDAYQDYLNQQAASQPVAQASSPAAAPAGEVLGESTEVPSQILPATGFDMKDLLILLVSLISLIGLTIFITKRSGVSQANS